MKFGVSSSVLAVACFLAIGTTRSNPSVATAFATGPSVAGAGAPAAAGGSVSCNKMGSIITVGKSVAHRRTLLFYGRGGLQRMSKDDLTVSLPARSRKFQLSDAPRSVNGDNSSSKKKSPFYFASLTENAILSASLLIALDIGFRKLFQVLSISFPSSLGGCCALFASMLLLPIGSNIFNVLSPGAALLAKWLPVFFVPSLITLPLAGSIGPPTEILKIMTVITVGFFFTLLTTAGSVMGIRKIVSFPATETGTLDNVDADEEMAIAAAAAGKVPPPTPKKPFSDTLVQRLRIVSLACGVGSIVTKAPTGPLASLGFLAITLHNFCFGARLPKAFTKIVHPLVTCTTVTWAMAWIVAKVTGATFVSMLKTYRVGSLNPKSAGAGDVLLFLLGPAVVSLAISMYDRRKLMKENLKEVVTGVGVSSVGGLFGTAAAVRLLKIASPALRLSLLSRNITSPLAMAIASLLGADVGLAVSMVVVTGLIGANFGASILTAFGVKDAVARGLGIGAAAHGLGTAAFVDETDAFPFAAISMALTATACTCLVSVPIVKKAILQVALGV